MDKVKDLAQMKYGDLDFDTQAEFDALINTLIECAESVIENYCDVPDGFFEDAGVTVTDEYHDMRESDDYLQLEYKPVISVSSASVNMAAYGSAPSWSAIDSNSIYLYTKTGNVYLYNLTFTVTEQNIKVTYVAGYSSTPGDISYICAQLCVNVLHETLQRKVSPMIRVDDWSVKLIQPGIFSKELKLMLKRYKTARMTIG